MVCAVLPLRSSIRLDLSFDFWDSRVDSIRAVNVGEDWGGEGEEDEPGVDRRGCIGGGGRLWERIELLEPGPGSRLL